MQAIKGNQRLCVRQAFIVCDPRDRSRHRTTGPWDLNWNRTLEWKTIGEPLNGMIPILEEWEINRPCIELGRDGLLEEFARLGVQNMYLLLNKKFGEMWLDFFVTKEGRHVFGTAYAWLISQVRPSIDRTSLETTRIMYQNAPAEFQNSLTTSLDVPGEALMRIDTYTSTHTLLLPSITTNPISGCKLIKYALNAWPRRIWDVCSNRVMSFKFLYDYITPYDGNIKVSKNFWAVSHSWTSDMELTWSEVNCYEWPIPLPRDVTLAQIRKRLLELGAQYCWLDVVCLRQALPARLTNPVLQSVHEYPERNPLPEEQVWSAIEERSQGSHEERKLELEKWRQDWENRIAEAEDKRQLEWELDVPTIGIIYRKAEVVVYYLNGLMREFERDSLDCSLCGKALSLSFNSHHQNPMCLTAPLPGSILDLHSADERHWFNRAWTVQEARWEKMIPGFDIKKADRGFFTTFVEPSIRKYTELVHLAASRRTANVGFLLHWMSTRAASNAVDKVAGLYSLLIVDNRNFKLPVYQAHQTPAEAWQVLVASLVATETIRIDSKLAKHLLVDWPVASTTQWYPEWDFICNFSKNRVKSSTNSEIELGHVNTLQKRQKNGRNSCQGVHNSDSYLELGKRDAAVWTDCHLELWSPGASNVYKVSIPVFDGRGTIGVQARVTPNLSLTPWSVPEGKYTLFLLVEVYGNDPFDDFKLPDSGLLCLPPCDGDLDNRKCCVKLAPLKIMGHVVDHEDIAMDPKTGASTFNWWRVLIDNLNGKKNIMYLC